MSTVDPQSPHRIVVGVDGSAQSIDALHWAARIAADTGAEIDAVTAWQYPTSYGASSVPDWDPGSDAASLLKEALRTAFGETLPDRLKTSVRQGHPAQVLIEASTNADMLVVGSRGHGGFIGLLLGSVSAYCAEHAHCPVVVARPSTTDPTPPTRAVDAT